MTGCPKSLAPAFQEAYGAHAATIQKAGRVVTGRVVLCWRGSA